MSDKIKNILSLILKAFITIAVCIVLYLAVLLIPQSAIKENCVKSAEYFTRVPLFTEIKTGRFNTRQDNYADCILINVMYNMNRTDGEGIWKDMIKASYYSPDGENVNESFSHAVNETVAPNIDYARYWHGSIVYLRPLFIVTDIEGARMFMGCIIIILIMAGAIILFKKNYRAAGICYLLAMIIVGVRMTCYCLEYQVPFLISGILTLIIILTKSDRKNRNREILLTVTLIGGIVTAFMDFLTAETLTFLMPVMISLAMDYTDLINENYNTKTEKKSGKSKKKAKNNKATDNKVIDIKSRKKKLPDIIPAGILWCLGYAGMFLLKWGLAAATIGGTAFKDALMAAGERISGNVYEGNIELNGVLSPGLRILRAVQYNTGMIYPFKNEMNVGVVTIITLVVLAVAAVVIYLFRTYNFKIKDCVWMLILAAVPYLRFIVLSNHSYVHYFFSYRALAVTVFIVLFLAWEAGMRNIKFRK